LFLNGWLAHAQGTFIYDQQSTNLVEGSASYQPFGQSFTPTLPSIGFITLNLYNNLAGTIYINLLSNSITGPIMSSTAPVFIPDNFFGITNFIFPVSVTITPGVIYYFQPLVQSGSSVASYITDGSYLGGTAFNDGLAWAGRNLWFQEGIIVVPEPSSALLALLGSGAWLLIRHKRAS
jgi:hypothetical protein